MDGRGQITNSSRSNTGPSETTEDPSGGGTIRSGAPRGGARGRGVRGSASSRGVSRGTLIGASRGGTSRGGASRGPSSGGASRGGAPRGGALRGAQRGARGGEARGGHSEPAVGPSRPGPLRPTAGNSTPTAGPSQPTVGPSQPTTGPTQTAQPEQGEGTMPENTSFFTDAYREMAAAACFDRIRREDERPVRNIDWDAHMRAVDAAADGQEVEQEQNEEVPSVVNSPYVSSITFRVFEAVANHHNARSLVAPAGRVLLEGRSNNTTYAETLRSDHGPFEIPCPEGQTPDSRPFGLIPSGVNTLDHDRIQVRIAATQVGMRVDRGGRVFMPLLRRQRNLTPAEQAIHRHRREILDLVIMTDNQLLNNFPRDYPTIDDRPLGFHPGLWATPQQIQAGIDRRVPEAAVGNVEAVERAGNNEVDGSDEDNDDAWYAQFLNLD